MCRCSCHSHQYSEKFVHCPGFSYFTLVKYLLYHIVLLTLSMPLAMAQDYPYIQLTTAQGLPSNYVYGVTEDFEGNIWAYTEAGIAKYDGYTFRTFTVKDGLPGNDVVYAQTGPQGRVWLQIYNNRPAYIWHDSIFTLFERIGFLTTYKGQTSVEDGTYALRTKGKALTEITTNIPGKVLKLFPSEFIHSHSEKFSPRALSTFNSASYHTFISRDSVHYYRIQDIRCLNEDIWVLPKAQNGATFIWKNQAGVWRWKKIGKVDLNKTSTISRSAILDERYVLFMHNLHKGFVLDRKADSFHYFDLNDFGINPKTHTAITSMADYFWLSTDDGAAAFYFNGTLKEVVRLSSLCENNLLNRTYKDRMGNIWIGTLEAGLFFIPYAYTRSRKLLMPRRNKVRFEQLIPWGKGEVMGITAHAGVYAISSNDIKELVKPNPKLLFRSAQKVGQELWVSSNLEAFRLQPGKKNWHKIPLQFKQGPGQKLFFYRNNAKYLEKYAGTPWAFNIVASTYVASKATFFGLASFHSFLKYDLKKQQVAYVNQDLRGNKCMYYDSSREVLLLGNWDGIVQWDEKKTQPYLKKYPQLKNITALYGTPDRLWIGTEGNGLFCYHYKKDSLQLVVDFPNVLQIHPGFGRSILVAGSGGVLVVDGVSGGVLHHFTRLDGLPANETQDVVQLDSSSLLIALPVGLYPMKLDFPALPLPDRSALKITAFSANDQLLGTTDWAKTLPHNRNNIRFNFHLQDIASRGHITYATRLEPLETEWHTQTDRSIQYPGLQRGSYRFHLKATNHYGKTVELEPFAFSIRPAWWETFWFRGLIWIVALSLFYFFIRLRLQRERAKLQKEKALNKQMAALELGALRAQMNPHFVFNALGAIQYYIQTHETEVADEYLTKFAMLMRKYLESSREQIIPLEREVSLLEYYTELEMMRFEGVFKTQIKLSDAIRQQNCYVPSMLIQPFVENAINHGLCERRDGQGLLRILFDGDEEHLLCTIEDNGIGRQNARKRSHKTHSSQAMRIVDEKVETLRLSGQAFIKVQVSDLQPECTDFPGTRVIIDINIPDDENH